MEEYDCPVCFRLLYAPVATHCGHTFCQKCFGMALQRQSLCPVCRTPAQAVDCYSVNRLLSAVIAREFPKEYQQRELEDRVEGLQPFELVNEDLPLHCCLGVAYFPGVRTSLIVKGLQRELFRENRCVGILSSVGGCWLGIAMEVKKIVESPWNSLTVELLAHARFGTEEIRSNYGSVPVAEFVLRRNVLYFCSPEYFYDAGIEVPAVLRDSVESYISACFSRISFEEKEQLVKRFDGVKDLGFYSLCVLMVPLDIVREAYFIVNPVKRMRVISRYIGRHYPDRAMVRISTNDSLLRKHRDSIVILVILLIIHMFFNK